MDLLLTLFDYVRKEPVAVAGTIQTVIALGILFGLDLSSDQVAGIMATVSAMLALIVRSKVSPTNSLVQSGQGKHES